MYKTLCLTYDKSIPFTLGFEVKDIIRFIYLATFIQPDGTLKDKSGQYVEWRDLPRVLSLDKRVLVDFISNIRNHSIIQEDSHGRLSIRKNLISVGNCDNLNNGYDKVYLDIDTIRELYETMLSRKHKALGYLFMAIPYANKEINCLCKNPLQPNVELIIPMSICEYCGFIDYDAAHHDDLRKMLLELRIGDEPLVTNMSLAGKNAYFINPRIYYGGTQWNAVHKYAGFEQPSIYREERSD